jgi:hypothetical protein
MKLRVGRKVSRTLYLQLDHRWAKDNDPLVGVVDSPLLAELIVDAVNKTGEVGPLVVSKLLQKNQIDSQTYDLHD